MLGKDCNAKNEDLRREYAKQLDDLMGEYQKLQGTRYAPLPCSSL